MVIDPLEIQAFAYVFYGRQYGCRAVVVDISEKMLLRAEIQVFDAQTHTFHQTQGVADLVKELFVGGLVRQRE